MSKYADALALIQYGATMAKKEEKPERAPKKDDKPKSLEELWVEEMKRRQAFDSFMGMMKKQNVEEKKDDKKSKITERDVVIFLAAFSPIIGAISLAILKWALAIPV